MPPLWMRFVIVVFWLVPNGWLAYRELWPRLQPDLPPPYTIDLVEEANQCRPDIHWTVLQNDRAVFQARTRIKRIEVDVFEMEADYTLPRGKTLSEGARLGWTTVRRMKSTYRVDASGNLLGLEVQLDGRAQVRLLLIPVLGIDLSFDIKGTVRGGQLYPTLQVTGGGQEKQVPLPASPVRGGGSVLLPLHPVNRIRGLHPGEHWRMSVVDPLEESLRALMVLGGPDRTLKARVLDEPQVFTSPTRKVSKYCLVIEYTGEKMEAKTWVEVGTGLVQRQEANFNGQRWVMNRD